ncbi:MAG: hypothetical protein R3A46_05840 [Thermomicrobiales bacterium]
MTPGSEPDQSPHHFAVVLSRSGESRIEERFAFGDDDDGSEPEVKARLDGYYRGRIAMMPRTSSITGSVARG